MHRQTIDALSAYQVAFDIFGNEYQLFLLIKEVVSPKSELRVLLMLPVVVLLLPSRSDACTTS